MLDDFCNDLPLEAGYMRQPTVPQFGPPFGQQFGPPFGQQFGPTFGPPFGGPPTQPGGPSAPPFAIPGTSQGAPPGPPPSFIPQQTQAQGIGILAVDPGAIRPCRFRFVYLWLTNRRQFWAWLVFVGPRSVAGWRWNGFRWVYFGVDLRSIESFVCF